MSDNNPPFRVFRFGKVPGDEQPEHVRDTRNDLRKYLCSGQLAREYGSKSAFPIDLARTVAEQKNYERILSLYLLPEASVVSDFQYTLGFHFHDEYEASLEVVVASVNPRLQDRIASDVAQRYPQLEETPHELLRDLRECEQVIWAYRLGGGPKVTGEDQAYFDHLDSLRSINDAPQAQQDQHHA